MKLPLLFLLFCLPFFSCQTNGQQGEITLTDETPKENPQRLEQDILADFTFLKDTLPATKHFDFIKRTAVADQQVAAFQNQCERSVAEIRAFLNSQKEIPKIQYCLYGSAEEKGLLIGNTDQSNVDFEKNTIHTVLNGRYGDNFIGKENELVLRHLLGKPKRSALERGLALYFTENWQRKGYDYWAKRLFDSGNMLSLMQVLEENPWGSSRFLLGCLSGSFVEFLITKKGKKAFLEDYLMEEFSEKEIAQLEAEWHQYLAEKPTVEKQIINGKLPYLKGFNFAHEGYRIYNGYISREAGNALDKMAQLNCNTACIVPYSFMRDPRKASNLPLANSPGGENDESVVHAARQAQQRGMKVVLKPQIWVGGGSWPGDIEMQTEQEWELWFQEYYEWILHYALLAEIHEMEVLCIGTEFAKATIQRPDDWRRLVQKIRQFYTGKLTYAANWGEEFENFKLWQDFDYIGINCYYPLSKNEKASDRELKAGFQKALQKIEKIAQKEEKPVLFTEIGFRSINHPWTQPHAEPNTTFNEQHQQRCYEIVFAALAKKEWCEGILWWKFPSYLSYRGRENSSFSPNQKITEQTIKKWFSKR